MKVAHLILIAFLLSCSHSSEKLIVQIDLLSRDTVRTGTPPLEIEVLNGNTFIYPTGLLDSLEVPIVDTLTLYHGKVLYHGLEWTFVEDFKVSQFPKSTFSLYRSTIFTMDQKLIVASGMGFIARHGLTSSYFEIISKFNDANIDDETKTLLLRKLEF